jgi:hypothetical protein
VVRPVVGAAAVAVVAGGVVGAAAVAVVPGGVVGTLRLSDVTGRVVGAMLGVGHARRAEGSGDGQTGDESGSDTSAHDVFLSFTDV